jgi:probable HAF family extracellular repeat protein
MGQRLYFPLLAALAAPLALLVLTQPGTRSAAAPRYRLQDLGTLGGSYSAARAINNDGCVTGQSTREGDGVTRAFFYDGIQMVELDTPGEKACGRAINDAGQVAGGVSSGGGDSLTASLFVWDTAPRDAAPGVRLDSFRLPGGWGCSAEGINDAGEVVGRARLSGQRVPHAFLWRDGETIDLGTFGGRTSAAWAVNRAGEVVGFAQIDGNLDHHAFIYSHGQLQDLGTLGGRDSTAYGINGYSAVVGEATTPLEEWHAFFLGSGRMKDLGTLGGLASTAYGINNTGRVVGESLTRSGDLHAFVWDLAHGLHDLNHLIPGGSPWQLRRARSINDRGQIVGWGVNADGQERAFLLTPE